MADSIILKTILSLGEASNDDRWFGDVRSSAQLLVTSLNCIIFLRNSVAKSPKFSDVHVKEWPLKRKTQPRKKPGSFSPSHRLFCNIRSLSKETTGHPKMFSNEVVTCSFWSVGYKRPRRNRNASQHCVFSGSKLLNHPIRRCKPFLFCGYNIFYRKRF